MIGSQATKGMHVLARFAPTIVECGVWGDGRTLRVIEAYPGACKASSTVQLLRRNYPEIERGDISDALTCALIGNLFECARGVLVRPPKDVPLNEGWIWAPDDGLKTESAQ